MMKNLAAVVVDMSITNTNIMIVDADMTTIMNMSIIPKNILPLLSARSTFLRIWAVPTVQLRWKLKSMRFRM